MASPAAFRQLSSSAISATYSSATTIAAFAGRKLSTEPSAPQNEADADAASRALGMGGVTLCPAQTMGRSTTSFSLAAPLADVGLVSTCATSFRLACAVLSPFITIVTTSHDTALYFGGSRLAIKGAEIYALPMAASISPVSLTGPAVAVSQLGSGYGETTIAATITRHAEVYVSALSFSPSPACFTGR